MSVDTKEKALNVMIPSGGMTLQELIDDLKTKLQLSESEIKEEMKKSFPDVTDWGF
tara:strand:+ start:288 stop:455 length:168 start_codon:yes stop_codon:yes gene_type:complete